MASIIRALELEGLHWLFTFRPLVSLIWTWLEFDPQKQLTVHDSVLVIPCSTWPEGPSPALFEAVRQLLLLPHPSESGTVKSATAGVASTGAVYGQGWYKKLRQVAPSVRNLTGSADADSVYLSNCREKHEFIMRHLSPNHRAKVEERVRWEYPNHPALWEYVKRKNESPPTEWITSSTNGWILVDKRRDYERSGLSAGNGTVDVIGSAALTRNHFIHGFSLVWICRFDPVREVSEIRWFMPTVIVLTCEAESAQPINRSLFRLFGERFGSSGKTPGALASQVTLASKCGYSLLYRQEWNKVTQAREYNVYWLLNKRQVLPKAETKIRHTVVKKLRKLVNEYLHRLPSFHQYVHQYNSAATSS